LLKGLTAHLDALFFRWVSSAAIGVSPECIRQVKELTNGRHCRLYEIRAQYRQESFENIPPPPHMRPFRIMYVGRIHRDKGVFDILDMAKEIEASGSGRVHWDICGAGPDLYELKDRHHA